MTLSPFLKVLKTATVIAFRGGDLHTPSGTPYRGLVGFFI